MSSGYYGKKDDGNNGDSEPNYPISDPPEHSFLTREQLKDTQIYYTHDNGGVPFEVFAHENAIEVYVDDEKLFGMKKGYITIKNYVVSLNF